MLWLSLDRILMSCIKRTSFECNHVTRCIVTNKRIYCLWKVKLNFLSSLSIISYSFHVFQPHAYSKLYLCLMLSGVDYLDANLWWSMGKRHDIKTLTSKFRYVSYLKFDVNFLNHAFFEMDHHKFRHGSSFTSRFITWLKIQTWL